MLRIHNTVLTINNIIPLRTVFIDCNDLFDCFQTYSRRNENTKIFIRILHLSEIDQQSAALFLFFLHIVNNTYRYTNSGVIVAVQVDRGDMLTVQFVSSEIM